MKPKSVRRSENARRLSVLFGVVAALLSSNGCGETRSAGQAEQFRVEEDGKLTRAYALTTDPAKLPIRRSVTGDFGDPIRHSDDVVTMQVLSAYIEDLPTTLTGSQDIILFAEVWENSAMGYRSPALNQVVYVAENQRVPGRINALGNLAYGPTRFKGHPLKVKFTLLVLQRRKGQQASSAANVVAGFMSASSAVTPYGAIASQAVGVVREILRNQPDVVAFDFEATFLSDAPEALLPVLVAGGSKRAEDLESALTSLHRAEQAADPSDVMLALEQLRFRIAELTGADLGQSEATGAEAPGGASRGSEIAAGEVAVPEVAVGEIPAPEIAGIEAPAAEPTAPTATEVIVAEPEATATDPLRATADALTHRANLIQAARAKVVEAQRAAENVMRSAEAVERPGAPAMSPAEADQLVATTTHALDAEIRLLRTQTLPMVRATLEAGRLNEQEDQLRARRLALSGVPAGRKSLWNASWPWLQYGVFSVVQTDVRTPVDELREGAPAQRLLPLDWNGHYRFDGGWIRDPNRDDWTQGGAGFRGNYLVFAITPGQISQQDSVLIAADAANRELMDELRANPDSVQQTVATLKAFGDNLVEQIVRDRADAIGRESAQRAQISTDSVTQFRQDFEARWRLYTNTLLHVEGAPRRDLLESMSEDARLKWEQRLEQIR